MSLIFLLQKYLLSILLPPASLLAVMVLSLAVKKHYLRGGKQILQITIFIFYLLSLGPVATMLIMPLEQCVQASSDYSEAQSIVVLTAGTHFDGRSGGRIYPDGSGLSRLVEAVRLWRESPLLPFVICGGRADPAKPEVSGAQAMRSAAIDLGVSAEKIVVEEKSSNTLEGAAEVRRLLLAKGAETEEIVLVTSAFHMGRAKAFFSEAGFAVAAAPCDWRGEQSSLTLASFIPTAGALGTSATAISESLVRLRYGL